jgi:hypothetical protein
MMPGAFGFFLSAISSLLGFAVHELLGAHPGHRRIRVFVARHGCPPVFFNQLTVLPGRDFLEFCQLCRRIGLPHEPLHADGDQDTRHRFVSPCFGHILRGTAQDLSPPGKAEDHDSHRADDNTPERRFTPWGDVHAIPPSRPACSSEHHAAQNLKYDIIYPTLSRC